MSGTPVLTDLSGDSFATGGGGLDAPRKKTAAIPDPPPPWGGEYRDMDLLEISETLLWICRTDRILAQPGGSMLVTGLSGVGRRDAVALAAYMLRMPVMRPSPGRPHRHRRLGS